MEYKILRLISFMIASFLPLLLTAIAAIASFLIIGDNLIGVGLVTFVAGFFSVVACGFAGFQITGQNAWVKAIQGEGMLLIGYSSAGMAQAFNCITRNNPSGGLDIVANVNGEEINLAYDKPMSYRLLAPVNAFIDLIHPKKKEDGTTEKSKTIITIPNEDFDKHALRLGYITLLFFNFETGTLTNKFAVNELEKFYAMKYLSLHLDRKLDIYIAELRMARKNFFAALLSKIQAFLKSPMFPILVIVIVGFFAVVFLIIMWPNISAFLSTVLPHTPGAVDGNTIVPGITHGSTGTVGGAITPLPKTP